MDKNQVTGIVLITMLMLGYFMYIGGREKRQDGLPADSVVFKPSSNSKLITVQPEALSDSVSASVNKEKYGEFAGAASVKEQELVLENKDVKIFFSTKGGMVKRVLLKNYLTADKKPLFILDEHNTDIDLIAEAAQGKVDLTDLNFEHEVKSSDTLQVVNFTLSLGADKFISQRYTLPPSGYLLSYSLSMAGLDNVIKNKSVVLSWKENIPNIENDVTQSRERSTVNYYTSAGEFNNLNEASKEEESQKIAEPVKWVSLKQKFFNTGIIAANSFENGTVRSAVNTADTTGIKELEMSVSIPLGDLKSGKGQYQLYFGPNHFQTLKKVTEGYHKNVYLGWPVINWVNRFVAIPTFNFLKGFIGSYGIIIIILAILVKLILLPLSFKSQVSMAKMKVLKPELDEIKSKFPDDMQKQQSEQMQLYQKVGINPLSGCIPVLLSMPVLLAMFSFFPNSIELRQESFLWANDLSTYDAPIKLSFSIPYYGTHVSIFTLLMTLSTIALTFFNNQVSTVTGPMKSVSYFMPVVFMFMLNSFPAGLSFYYLVSNILSIGQQFLIKNFVDEDKIRQKLEETRKKNATGGGDGKKSRWMQRMEEAMKAKEASKRNK